MVKKSFSQMTCPVAQALEVIGEWWSILILRDFMISGGRLRFEQLKDGLGISRNVLTERLRKFTKEEIVTKVPISEGARRMEYQLTEKGWDLMPVMMALSQWHNHWKPGPERDNLQFLDKKYGQPLEKFGVFSKDGRRLKPSDIMPVANTHEAAEYLTQLSCNAKPSSPKQTPEPDEKNKTDND
ncbi:MAG: helix-turn-helix transcriptional regulator [Spongiibacteraceae bacterium]|nr:helix-turn-helix transcriptional regulator [Spongiibacteraceae bacterium]